MKWLMLGMLVLVASVSVAVFTLPDPGYVLIGYGKYSVETSLLVFVALFFMIYMGLRLLANLWRAPLKARRWALQRKHRHLQNSFNKAVIELADGRLESAERRLFRLTSSADAPLDIFFSAARAANRLEADERRDVTLKRALQRYPEAEIAVALVEAELQLSRAQLEQARTTLTRLRTLAPHNKQTLRMLMHLYLQLEEWGELRELLTALQQNHVLDGDQWQKLAVQVYRERVREFGDEKDVATLSSAWQKLPPPVQADTGLVAGYIEQLVRLGASGQAERLLCEQLKRSWNPRLVYLYGEVVSDDMAAQQNVAERWLDHHPQDPVLMLTLGKLSLRNQLWGKAQTYFEASIAQQASSEAYRLLGLLLDQLGEPDRAAECYRKGVELLDQAGFMTLGESVGEESSGEKPIPLSHIA